MADFISRMLDHFVTGGACSPCLEPMIGLYDEVVTSDSLAEDGSPDEDATVYFTKPANAEQLKIVRQYRKTGRVVVQGPPGTGKSHTIANLIGHFLAEGKTVLVTAETSRALAEVRERVTSELQPLCISVTDGESRGQDLLKAGIAEMHRVKSDEEPDRIARKVKALEEQRYDLIGALKRARRDLFIAREGEIVPITYSGQALTPSEAARWVAEHEASSSWLPGVVELGSIPPISQVEAAELYLTNGLTSFEDETNYCEDLVPIGDLPLPGFVNAAFSELRDLVREKISLHEIDMVRFGNLGRDSRALEVVYSRVSELLSRLSDADEGWRDRLRDEGYRDSNAIARWTAILDQGTGLARKRPDVSLELNRYGIKVPEESLARRLLPILREIRTYLEAGKKITGLTKLVRPKWKEALEAPLVNGRCLETADEVNAIVGGIELEQQEAEFSRLWDGIALPVGIASAGPQGSPKKAEEFRLSILACLGWATDEWEPLRKSLEDIGFDMSKAQALMPAALSTDLYGKQVRWMISEVVEPALGSASKQCRLDELRAEAVRIETTVRSATNRCQCVLLRNLSDAIAKKDTAGYEVAYVSYKNLVDRAPQIRRRAELLEKIRPFAKEWARVIGLREGIHELSALPGDLGDAWKWNQLEAELQRRHSLSLFDINKEIANISEHLALTTRQLVKYKAWGHLHSNIKPAVQAALERYRLASSVLTGKRAAVMARAAKEAMTECAFAVPVWIMPVSRVATSFDPVKNRFDVVIMDEASQVNLTGLAVLQLAKTAVIVGDDEQTEPIQVGVQVERMQGLCRTYLGAIKGGEMWNEQTSIYRLALGPYAGGISLREHFRCVPDIITYSNWLSYNRTIRPLRDDGDVRTKPHVLHFPVPPGESRFSVRQVEAEYVISLLYGASEQPEYEGLTFGVVAMRGAGQNDYARMLDSLATKRLGTSWREIHKFQCGTPPQFQGAERDVIFLAMGDEPPELGHQLKLMTAEAMGSLWKKRYNVAASRAKNQLWVVSSFSKEQVQGNDIRHSLLDFAQNPATWRQRMNEENPRAESEFERLVFRDLRALGYKLVPQYPVGNRRIDIVAESDGKRCAIECDGERYHRPDQLESDIARQSDLERAGNWKFVRIRGSRYFRDPVGAIEEACSEMAGIGIFPTPGSDEILQARSDLLERIVATAQEARFAWASSGADLAQEAEASEY